MPRPQPEDYTTRAEYRWALKLWKRKHGGSLLMLLAIAVFFGALSGSQVGIVLLVAVALLGWLYARTRP